MAASIRLETKGVEEIQKAMDAYGDGYGEVLKRVLYDDASLEISEGIAKLLPVSGRTFKGHSKGAKATGATGVFMRVLYGDSLTLEVKTRPRFGYLYFPDTGTGYTQPMVQDFMGRGLEAATPKVVELCVAALTEKL